MSACSGFFDDGVMPAVCRRDDGCGRPGCPYTPLVAERDSLRSALATTTAQRDEAWAERDRMRAVYELAMKLRELRVEQSALDDLNYDRLDGPIVDLLDAIDSALAMPTGKDKS